MERTEITKVTEEVNYITSDGLVITKTMAIILGLIRNKDEE